MSGAIGSPNSGAARPLRVFLTEHVAPYLRSRQFRQRGQVFSLKRGDNVVGIRFQARSGFFTCDLSVASGFLARTAVDWEPPEQLTYRLGPLAKGYDKWWDLASDLDAVAADFRAALSIGLAFIEPLSSDQGILGAILSTARLDPRGIAPLHAEQLERLVRAYGLPPDADPQVRVRDGSTLDLTRLASAPRDTR